MVRTVCGGDAGRSSEKRWPTRRVFDDGRRGGPQRTRRSYTWIGHPLAEQAIASSDTEYRQDLAASADLLSMRETGPVLVSVALREDELELELDTDLPARPGALYELVQTPPVVRRCGAGFRGRRGSGWRWG